MSFWGKNFTVKIGDGAQKDAFGRLRVSQPTEIFSASCEHDARVDFYEDVLSGSASATYNSSLSGVELETTLTGDAAIRQSKQYVRYRPGKGQQIFVTGNFYGQEAGITKRMGYFDDDTQSESNGDGIFFEVSDSDVYAVLRSSTSGASVDTKISRENWSKDKLDGTGPSGEVLDLLKMQVAVFDFGWLGAAVIRWGLVINGEIIIVHEEYPSNNFEWPFMSHASLPVRWEISSGAGGSTGSMLAVCASVQSEGGFNTLGVRRSASVGSTALSTSATAIKPLISIRLKDGYKRSQIIPESFSIIADGDANYEILILINANLGVSAGSLTWNAVTNSTVEYNTNATDTISSYDSVLSRSYGLGGGGPIKATQIAARLSSDVPVTSSYDGTKDTLTIAIRPLSTVATDYFGSIEWREFA